MDLQTVKKVAKLARLEISEVEAENYTKELSSIFKFIEQLSEVDVSKISDTSIGTETLRFRADKVTDGAIREDVLKNAPDAQFDCFAVPKVIE